MPQISKAIINQNNEFLLQLRDDHPGISYPNQWSFFGGEIEKGESPWQALQREIMEELSWHPDRGRYLYQWDNLDHPGYSLHFFALEFKGRREGLVLKEGQDLNWFTVEDIILENKIAPHVLMHVYRFLDLSS